jgi:cell wall assembly regulator SMI1
MAHLTLDELVIQLRGRYPDLPLPAPASPEEILRAEELIGFDLPVLLRTLYTEVSNGRFGPLVLPLFSPTPHIPVFSRDEDGAIDMYLAFREACLDGDIDLVEREEDSWAPQFYWPPKMIPFCEWGCNIRSCVDCSKPDLPVMRFDPNKSMNFRKESSGLARWLEDWLTGKDLSRC